MSHPAPPDPVFFFIAFTTKDKTLLEKALPYLEEGLGSLKFASEFFDFSKFTDYYHKEMGKPLFKNFLFFTPLKNPEKLIELKHLCYKIEKTFSTPEGARRINLDPGYMELSKIVLATFKNFSHRIYLGNSVYAEVTLIFKNGAFQGLPWSYPDYLANLDVFHRARNIYKELLKRVKR